MTSFLGKFLRSHKRAFCVLACSALCLVLNGCATTPEDPDAKLKAETDRDTIKAETGGKGSGPSNVMDAVKSNQ